MSSLVTPAISVVVPTRNRPDQASSCVRSILAREHEELQLLVVDQSDSSATAEALTPFRSDSRFQLVRSPTRGASTARNKGVAASSGRLVAFTDDDCRVAPDWAAQIVALFQRSADAGVVFGRVVLPEQRPPDGFGAEFEPREREFQYRLPAADTPWGISANMAARREVFARVGSFDALLGPGATFPAGEDTDFIVRTLAADIKVLNAPEVLVEHLGVREGHEAGRLARGYGVAIGAALMKHVRLRTKYGGSSLLAAWLARATLRSLGNAVRGRRPTGLGFVLAMVDGAVRSLRYQVDHERGLFVVPSDVGSR